MLCCRNVVSLPFTAGRLIIEGSSCRDGSIASGLLLALMTAVLSAIIIAKELTPSTDDEIINISFIVVILGLHILGLVIIRLRNPDTYTNTTEHQHKLSKLTLACLCVFGLFAFFHASIHLSCNIMCSINTSELLCTLRMVHAILQIVHYPVQIAFFASFLNRKLKPSIFVHYLFMAQMGFHIISWNYHMLEGLRFSAKSTFSNNTFECGNTTEIHQVIQLTEYFTFPTVVGFDLMTVLLVAMYWPVATRDEALHNELDPIKTDEDVETSLLLNDKRNPQSDCARDSHVTNSIIAFIMGIVTNCPLFGIKIARSYNNSHSIHEAYDIVHLISKIILLIVITRGFNLLAKQCQVIHHHVDGFTLSNFLLGFGMWGLVFHETFRLVTVIREGSTSVKPVYIIQTLLTSVTAAQLTIFMLQMKYYKRKSSPPSFSSIRGNSLFLAGYIGMYWIMNTFVEFSVRSTTDPEIDIFLPYLVMAKQIVFPFVIFFRFQCTLLLTMN
jgi:hypothetical protein